jgi:hypothetical protein
VVDAFSSDAIPVHLVTREALRLYLSRLEPGGLVAFHISSRYLRLEPVLAALARDARLAGRIREDAADDGAGKAASRWVILARREEDLGPLAGDRRWRALAERPGVRVWTDDFSDPVRVLSWGLSGGRSAPSGRGGAP